MGRIFPSFIKTRTKQTKKGASKNLLVAENIRIQQEIAIEE